VNSANHHLRHLRDLPHIMSDDGRPSLRQVSNDGIEARARSFHNYIQTLTSSFGVHLI